MSRIDDLIKKLCPEGVERVRLGEAFDLKNGYTPSKDDSSYWDCGIYPWFVMDDIRNHGTILNDSSQHITHKALKKSGLFKANSIILATSATIGVHALITVDFLCNQRFTCIYPQKEFISKIDMNFMYYFMFNIDEWCKHNIMQGGFASVDMKGLRDIEIPLPPLSIQQEIVSVLDSFTTLIDKMKKEVELRKKQMEYYREKLLTPKEGWTNKKLGEVGVFTRGNGLQKTDFREEGFPCIHYGQIHTYYGTSTSKTKSFCDVAFAKKLKKAQPGNLLIATTSEDVEACCKSVVWLGDKEIAYSGDSYCFAHSQNPKYMSYLFQTEMFAKQKRMVATGAKVVRVSGESMATFEFGFPSLSTQSQIVSTLDRFESYIAKLEQMITLRQKQYEYYREKLLTFE